MYVCVCNAVNDRQVKQALSKGIRSLHELHVYMGYKSCCGKCTACIRKMINEYLESNTISNGELSCKAKTQL